MSKQFTIALSRIELQWLYRQFKSAQDRAAAIIAPPASPSTEEIKNHDDISKLALQFSDRLSLGQRQRLELVTLKEELEDALTLIGDDESSAREEINKRLSELPKEEEYKLTFDRETAKFTIKLLEKDIQTFNSHVIPNTEKRSDFPDPIMTKTYWVNRARRARNALESLKVRLEKNL